MFKNIFYCIISSQKNEIEETILKVNLYFFIFNIHHLE